ncbi:hypothetical protein VP01_6912g1, partial [Puccinia sorghi]
GKPLASPRGGYRIITQSMSTKNLIGMFFIDMIGKMEVSMNKRFCQIQQLAQKKEFSKLSTVAPIQKVNTYINLAIYEVLFAHLNKTHSKLILLEMFKRSTQLTSSTKHKCQLKSLAMEFGGIVMLDMGTTQVVIERADLVNLAHMANVEPEWLRNAIISLRQVQLRDTVCTKRYQWERWETSMPLFFGCLCSPFLLTDFPPVSSCIFFYLHLEITFLCSAQKFGLDLHVPAWSLIVGNKLCITYATHPSVVPAWQPIQKCFITHSWDRLMIDWDNKCGQLHLGIPGRRVNMRLTTTPWHTRGYIQEDK